MPIVERHLNDPDNNYDAARELLTAHPKLTAVVCTTDTQALGVLRYARDNGIRVPEDLSVTGFDGIEVARREVEAIVAAGVHVVVTACVEVVVIASPEAKTVSIWR